MKNNEKEIIEIAKKVLQELDPVYFDEKNIEGAWFKENDPIRGDKANTQAVWLISINEPIFDSTNFLRILDETGEPLYIQTNHKVHEIIKNDEGKYVLKE